jgi:hypothetical protein
MTHRPQREPYVLGRQHWVPWTLPATFPKGRTLPILLAVQKGEKKNSKIDPLKVQGLGVHYFSQLVLPQILMVLVQSMIRRLPKGD